MRLSRAFFPSQREKRKKRKPSGKLCLPESANTARSSFAIGFSFFTYFKLASMYLWCLRREQKRFPFLPYTAYTDKFPTKSNCSFFWPSKKKTLFSLFFSFCFRSQARYLSLCPIFPFLRKWSYKKNFHRKERRKNLGQWERKEIAFLSSLSNCCCTYTRPIPIWWLTHNSPFLLTFPKKTSCSLLFWCLLSFIRVLLGGAVITAHPRNQTVQAGQGVEFACAGQANPRNVSIHWYKDGKPVGSFPGLDSRTAVRSNGSLVFDKVEAGDEGKYTCKVSNGIGAPIDTSAFLAVECKINAAISQ